MPPSQHPQHPPHPEQGAPRPDGDRATAPALPPPGRAVSGAPPHLPDIDGLRVGQTAVLRRRHPCGADRWRVERVGAAVGLRCSGCGRRVLLDRAVLRRRLARLLDGEPPPPGAPPPAAVADEARTAAWRAALEQPATADPRGDVR